MIHIKNKIILIALSLLIFFALAGCCGAKKTSTAIAKKETEVKNSVPALQEDFEKTAGNKIYFSFDSFVLSAEAKKTLLNQANWLNAQQKTIANIEGYCDEIGTKAYNFGLGLRRAEAAKKFLVKSGVNQDRLVVISYGKSKANKKEHTKAAHKRDRRVVTIVIR